MEQSKPKECQARFQMSDFSKNHIGVCTVALRAAGREFWDGGRGRGPHRIVEPACSPLCAPALSLTHR